MLPNRDTVKKRAGQIAVALIIYAVLISIVFLILYPLLSHVSEMFMSFEDLMDNSVIFIPRNPSLAHIRQAAQGLEYGSSMLRSLGLCLLVAGIQTIVCTLVGYGFARYPFPFKKLAFGAVIFTMLVPTPLLMPSLYTRFRDFLGLNLLDTFWPFAILSLAGLGFKNGLYMFLVRQFFRNMPRELEESGRMDGAGFLRIFFSIMLPNAATIAVTVFLFAFSWQWTDQYWSTLFLPTCQVLPSALSALTKFGESILEPVTRTALVHTGIILVILPILVLYLVLQKFFIQGIARSGIVG